MHLCVGGELRPQGSGWTRLGIMKPQRPQSQGPGVWSRQTIRNEERRWRSGERGEKEGASFAITW